MKQVENIKNKIKILKHYRPRVRVTVLVKKKNENCIHKLKKLLKHNCFNV